MIKIYPQQNKIMSNKSKSVLLTLMLLMSTTVVSADPGSGLCDGVDGGPDNCPLDTWVIVLVIFASAFAAFTLFRRKKATRASSL